MKLNYEVLKDILQWAETLKGASEVRVAGLEGDISVQPTDLVRDHTRLMIVSGWLDGNANDLSVCGLTIKGHSLLRNEDVERELRNMDMPHG